MKCSQTCRRGIYYASVCAVFGGIAWGLGPLYAGDISDIPAVASVGFLFWGLVGLVVGRYDPARGSVSHRDVPMVRRSMLGALGRFIYRTVIGALAGFLVAALVELALLGVAVVTYGDIDEALKVSHRNQIAQLVQCSFMGAMVAAQISGVLFAWIWKVDEVTIAVLGSFCGALVGSIGGLIPAMVLTGMWMMYGALLGGGFGGVLASILAGLLLLRRRRTPFTEAFTNSESMEEYP
jgi:hypothetical protein